MSNNNVWNNHAGSAALFQPGQIGRLKLRNRFVQSPIYTMFATADGEAGPRMIEYYRERARGGVGLMITENAAIDWQQGRAVGNPLRLDEYRFRAGLSDLVEAVHNEGAKIAAQLHHGGRQATVANIPGGAAPVAPTADITSAYGDPPRALSVDEIPGIIEKYVAAAQISIAAGFDAVEVHGAHGYLPSQFLSPQTNRRNDAYGGDFAGRARFGLELVQALRAAVGPDFPLLYRASVYEPYEGGLSLEEGVRFCALIAPYLDGLDISAGNYDTMSTVLWTGVPGGLLGAARAVKAAVSIPVIGVGRLAWALDEAAAAVAAGEVDFIALGRGNLAEPNFVAKTRQGRDAEVRRCIGCNECAISLFLGRRAHCVINPELAREADARVARRAAPVAKTLLVIGAGPAGCEAARLGAIRGHRVTLMEQSERIGGQLKAAAALPIRAREFASLIAFYQHELERLGVDVRLGQTASSADLAGFDEVMVATGAGASDVPGGAINAFAMLMGRDVPAAAAINVFGGGEIALTAASWLHAQGKRVSLHEPAGPIGGQWNGSQVELALAYLQEAGVEIHENAAPPADPKGWVWEPELVPADALADLIDDVRVVGIGTLARGGALFEATQSGFWTAARV